MTNVLSEARQDVSDALADVLSAYPYLPNKQSLTGPLGIVMPGDPYLEPGRTLGSMKVNLRLFVMTKQGQNETEAQTLDDLIVEVIQALEEIDWFLTTVDQPVQVEDKGMLGTVLTITSQYRKDDA